MIQHHPHRPGSNLRAEFVRRFARHGSILLGSWSLRETRRGSHALFDGVIAVVAPDYQPAIRPIPEGIDGLRAVVVCGGHEQNKNTGAPGRQGRRCLAELQACELAML
jgi:hypothetical protein